MRLATMTLATLIAFPVLADGLCSLAYYPVAVGDVNEYRMTSVQLDADGAVLNTVSNTYTDEVTAVDTDSYRTRSTSSGNSSESDWGCSDEGIDLRFGEFPNTKITTTGVTVPSTMEVGSEWIQTFVSETPDMTQTSRTVNRITAREEVTVPAGTFDAYRVDYEVETTIPGMDSSLVTGTQWYAIGAGIVKSTSVINMTGEIHSIETTIELVKRTTH